jgi:hypothetical protein
MAMAVQCSTAVSVLFSGFAAGGLMKGSTGLAQTLGAYFGSALVTWLFNTQRKRRIAGHEAGACCGLKDGTPRCGGKASSIRSRQAHQAGVEQILKPTCPQLQPVRPMCLSSGAAYSG